MPEEAALEGWAPQIGTEVTLEQLIERAFDYRGNVTVIRRDGSSVEGYLFNRNRDVADPFVEMFDKDGHGPLTILYGDIRTIRFTGKDTAAGNSYAAWLRAKEAAKKASVPPAADA